jgi:hypothetical protein
MKKVFSFGSVFHVQELFQEIYQRKITMGFVNPKIVRFLRSSIPPLVPLRWTPKYRLI